MQENLQLAVTLLGVFFLGGFVGFLLGLAINFASSINLKVASALIGAALGGTPIVFMRGLSFEKWMYPIGLVVGFFWVRVVRAREKMPMSAQGLAVSDTILVILFTSVIIICAAASGYLSLK